MKKVLYGFLILAVACSLTFMSCNPSADDDDSVAHPDRGDWKYFAAGDCYGVEGVVYCESPLDEELQSINIYVPTAYLNEDGTVKVSGMVGNYTAVNAPIVYKNGVAGYSEAAPRSISSTDYVEDGMIYVSVGSRGKQTENATGTFIGKSPEGLVDLKAGVRFLKHFDDEIPGDSDKIISVGASAGGAMSTLLGTTGNNTDYDTYLAAIDAWDEAGDTDDIYGAMCYCPIIDLENSDLAYEWMFINDTSSDGFMGHGAGDLSAFQQALSADLFDEYITYFNSLGLGVSLNADGRSGTAYDLIMGVLEDAATTFLEKLEAGEMTAYSTTDTTNYIDGSYTKSVYNRMSGQFEDQPGVDKSAWLSWDGSAASITDLDDMIDDEYLGRLKTCPAFDDFDYAQAENQEFGDADTDLVHFDPTLAQLLVDNDVNYNSLAGYLDYRSDYNEALTDADLQDRVYLINPMNYIGTAEVCDTAPYFRIRVGTQDPHTAFTIAGALSLALAGESTDVDYAMVWDEGHGDADYEGEFVEWIESLP